MALYLDSAQLEDAKIAITWGWVTGITTNPTLLAKSPLSPADTLSKLAKICPRELYYQLTTSDFQGMVTEARKAKEIIGEKLVLKIPATSNGFQTVAHLSPDIPCAVTAIYSPAQAAVAKEAGAKYAIAYVNRATRLLGDGIRLVADMADILQDSNTKILAASIKSPEEAFKSLQAGAYHLTLPLPQLQALTQNSHSEATVNEFAEKGKGILD
ncbi:transaldolase family protein [Spirulina sp. CS-785/01]|uniref:transaldolase family protein n=1 Tax=Spirulina sp. CS-785/01 TaxID=3021716 RepID=UPI00232BFBF7|nr:transaldolase family protein [Spirulina sp. CS-785/01]MDB9314408.1 transaldolase family protein [Spirulina sp. CS-785/01]